MSKTQVLQDLVKLRKVLENCLSSNNKEEKDEVLSLSAALKKLSFILSMLKQLNEEKKKENILKSLDKGLNIVLCILYIMHLFEADRIYNEEIVETIVEYIKKCVELLFKKKTGDEVNCDKETKCISKNVKKLFEEVWQAFTRLLDTQVLPEMILRQLISSSFILLSHNRAPLKQATHHIILIFGKYSSLRSSIIEDLGLIIISSESPNSYLYPLTNGRKVSIISILVTSLLQQNIPSLQSIMQAKTADLPIKSSSKRGRKRKIANHDADKEDNAAECILKSNQAFQGTFSLACLFVNKMILRCGNEDSDITAKAKDLFKSFLDDIYYLTSLPSYPASQLIIIVLSKLLASLLKNKICTDASLKSFILDCIKNNYIFLHNTSQLKTKYNSHEGIKHQKTSKKGVFREKYKPLDYQGDDDGMVDVKVLSYEQQQLKKILLQKCHNDEDQKQAGTFWLYHWTYIDSFSQSQEVQHSNFKEAIAMFKQNQENPTNTTMDDSSHVTSILMRLQWIPHVQQATVNILVTMLTDTSVCLRSKTLTCLAEIFQHHPQLINRKEVMASIKDRFMDSSSLVRASAVELVADQSLQYPALMTHFYPLLKMRIMDVGLKVRKGIAFLFKSFIVKYSDDEQMVGLVDDMVMCLTTKINEQDDAAKKSLVEALDHCLIYNTPTYNLSMFSSCLPQYNGYLSLDNAFKMVLKRENSNVKKCISELMGVCVEKVVSMCAASEASGVGDITQYLSLLKIVASIDADILHRRLHQLFDLLTSDGLFKLDSSGSNICIIATIIKTLIEKGVELNEKFNEDALMKTLKKLISCRLLKAVDRVVGLLMMLIKRELLHHHCMGDIIKGVNDNLAAKVLENQERAETLHLAGILCKHQSGCDSKLDHSLVLEALLCAVEHEDQVVSCHALISFGYYMENPNIKFFDPRLVDFMHAKLSQPSTTPSLIINKQVQCIFKMIINFLQRNESHDENTKNENERFTLREYEDTDISNEVSGLVQRFLPLILKHLLLQPSCNRILCMNLLTSVLKQALVHPALCLPHLIATSSLRGVCEDDSTTQQHSSAWMHTIKSKYPSFLGACAMNGVKLSYQLSKTTNDSMQKEKVEKMGKYNGFKGLLRGYSRENNMAHLHLLFTLLGNNKQFFLSSMLKLFEKGLDLQELLYIADNLASFPYSQQTDVLFVIKQADSVLSYSGSNVYQTFKELLIGGNKVRSDRPERISRKETKKENVEDKDDGLNVKSIKESINALYKGEKKHDIDLLYKTSQTTLLLIHLRQHLKSLFALSETIIEEYACSIESQLTDKDMPTKQGTLFNPKHIIDFLTNEAKEKDAVDGFNTMRNFFNRDS